MVAKGKNSADKKYPPVNESVHYYTDPIYSTDALYGFEENEDSNKERTSKDKMESCAFDEPVESWGWINNIDY